MDPTGVDIFCAELADCRKAPLVSACDASHVVILFGGLRLDAAPRYESISVRLSLVLRIVDLGQIYLAHATIHRPAGPARTVSMYSAVVVLPQTTSTRARISARLGRQPSRTLSATAVITARRCSAVSPSKRSGQRCSHVEESGWSIATILPIGCASAVLINARLSDVT